LFLLLNFKIVVKYYLREISSKDDMGVCTLPLH